MSKLISLSENDVIITENILPSKTYAIDLKNKRIAGFLDGLDAVCQFIYKALNTARFKHLIYSNQYGSDITAALRTEDVSQTYIENLLPQLIEDTLLCDERIKSISDFTYKLNDERVFVEFNVQTIFGNATIREVI